MSLPTLHESCGSRFLAITVGFLLAVLSFQAQFYYPDKQTYTTPAQFGLKYEVVTFESLDGTKLSGWFVPATKKPLGTVIHFHGNAQNMTAHFPYVAWLPASGFNVFAFDYRGYGASEGKLQRKGIHEDGVAALNYLKSRKDIAQDRLFVLGQSLGGAIAVAAVASNRVQGIRAVVVDSAFYSYTSIARDKAPEALVDLLVSDDFSPGPLIPQLSPIPVLIIHGTADQVVPFAHGQRLFEAAKDPKTLWTVPKGEHLAAFYTLGSTYRPKLIAFFKQCLSSEPPRPVPAKPQ